MSSIVVAYSIHDTAGVGIAKNIVKLIDCKLVNSIASIDSNYLEGLAEMYMCRNRDVVILGFSMDVIELEVLERVSKSTKYMIIVSKHSAKSGKPSLTTHTPGNLWGRNDFGGRPWEIPPSNPILMWYVLKELYRYSSEYFLHGYTVCYEVTHHGPTSLTKPITFVELGSSENEWSDVKAQKVVALATISAINKVEHEEPKCVVTVGFGGTHYAPLFTKRALEENECYGHMVPNYVIKELTLDELSIVTRKVISLTPGCSRVVIEKMRKEVREIIEEEARARSIEVVRC